MRDLVQASNLLDDAKDLIDVLHMAGADFAGDGRGTAIRTAAHEIGEKIEKAHNLLGLDGTPEAKVDAKADAAKPASKPGLTHYQRSTIFDLEPLICDAVHMAHLASEAIETAGNNHKGEGFKKDDEAAHFAAAHLWSMLNNIKAVYYRAFETHRRAS